MEFGKYLVHNVTDSGTGDCSRNHTIIVIIQGSKNDRRENGMNLRKSHILAIGCISGMIGLATTSCTGTADSSSGTVAIPTVTCEKLTSSIGITTLNWTPPTQNTDDSALSTASDPALAGYIIYFRPTSGATACSINVEDPAATGYPITNLLTNTEYAFSVTAYNSDGVESDLSNIVIKTVN